MHDNLTRTDTHHTPRMPRRDAIVTMGLGGLALGALATGSRAQDSSSNSRREQTQAALGYDASKGEYTLPPLPYGYNALEPYIDEQTMRIHHDKHHAGYVKGLNTALAKLAGIRAGNVDAGETKFWSRNASFHGSGHVNHAMFWAGMRAGRDDNKPGGALAERINKDFGSFSKFSSAFRTAASQVEGSGWGWLVWEPVAGQLLVIQGEKQQDLMMTGVIPLLGVDVWEHAYYLKYQNNRGDYLDAFMHVINWDEINRRFEHATA